MLPRLGDSVPSVRPGSSKDEVAVAAIVRDGKLLLGHRHPERRWYPDCWDLIGGHIELGETAADAIRRECREELTIAIREPRPIEIPFSAEDANLHGFLVTRWDGTPMNAAPDEHDDLAWFTVADLPSLRLADSTYVTWLPRLIQSATTNN